MLLRQVPIPLPPARPVHRPRLPNACHARPLQLVGPISANSRGPQRAYKNLKPLHRAGLGAAVIAWGAAGLWLSDRAEERYFTPTEEEKMRIERVIPRVTWVDKEK